MAIRGVFHSVKTLVTVASKKLRNNSTLSRLSVSSRRRVTPLLSRGASFIPFFGAKKKVSSDDCKNSRTSEETDIFVDIDEDEDDETNVWRKTILMGEKCKPLDFSGVIYYDCEGRQLSEFPASRSPLRSPLPSFAYYSEVEKDLED
ncbi:uncharacterized protein LOC120259460 [Dioscorea cayenensis subsp. rotundata]|uniref:Uncharacterized protein LOC120259460 n=1 Tax=Dioscorea cayennensis subsp. rotundata TaxID=55577 RepID=A0AB40B6Z7_DIOCR|nr:uncharacterized protein LOC120259460 [Dioscorea cayenensis subsp. rotundata]